jgi:hypothetical protein
VIAVLHELRLAPKQRDKLVRVLRSNRGRRPNAVVARLLWCEGESHSRCREASLARRLQDPVERDLLEKTEFERLMGSLGISHKTTLILYRDKNNWFAASPIGT